MQYALDVVRDLVTDAIMVLCWDNLIVLDLFCILGTLEISVMLGSRGNQRIQ